MQTPFRRLIPIIALLLWTASPDAQRPARPDSAQTRFTPPAARRATGEPALRRREVRGRSMPGSPITETVTPTVFEQQPDQPGQVKHEPREQRRDSVAGQFDQVRLLQPKNDKWTDVTLLKGAFAPEASTQRVCGELSSLSPVSVALRKRS